MAKPPTDVRIESFALGMNTRKPDFRLGTEAGAFLRDALNVDITEAGTVKRRRGYELAVEAAGAHSLWSDGTSHYFVGSNMLYALDDELDATAVAAVQPGRFVSYCTAPEGGAYWTDGAVLQRAVGSTTAPLNPPPPPLVPSAAAASGSLNAGRYTYCFTQVDSAGRESAATHPEQILLDAGSAVAFELPDAPTAGNLVRAYLSGEGGSVPYLVYEFDSAGSFTADQPPSGIACATLGLAPMPAGSIVRHSNGRLLVAAGSILYYSEPFAPGLYDPVSGYIPLPADITIVEPVEGGFFLAADKTYWLAGDVAQASLTEVLPYGAVLGSGVSRRDSQAVHWMSTRGIVEAGPGGAVKNLQDQNVKVIPGSGGATLVREANGMQQALSSMFGSSTHQHATASSYMDAEIVNGATA